MKTLKLIRELKNISLRQIASAVGVSFAAVAQVERGLPSLSPDKIQEIARSYGIVDISENDVVFDCRKVHYMYIPVSYRRVQWDEFYAFLSMITPVEMIFFIQRKDVVAVGIKDKKECIFLFRPRSGKKLCKEKDIQGILEKVKIKKDFTQKIDIEKEKIDFRSDDIKNYFSSVYCYSCPRLAVVTPDGNIQYKPVVPISTILSDFYDYLLYENDNIRKKHAIESILAFVFVKILKNFDKNEYDKALERAFEIWDVSKNDTQKT